MSLVHAVLRPFGYLAYLIGLFALSASASLLGERDDLGFFAGRLARMLWRYRAATRPGVRVAWALWAVLFAVALSPADPLPTRWDEVALAVAALAVLQRRALGGLRGER
jgi:hypothetical protein